MHTVRQLNIKSISHKNKVLQLYNMRFAAILTFSVLVSVSFMNGGDAQGPTTAAPKQDVGLSSFFKKMGEAVASGIEGTADFWQGLAEDFSIPGDLAKTAGEFGSGIAKTIGNVASAGAKLFFD